MKVRPRLPLDDSVVSRDFTDYGEAVLRHMLLAEQRTLPLPLTSPRATAVPPATRAGLVLALGEVQDALELRPETLQLAVNVADRVAGRVAVAPQDYHLLGLTALWVAAKYEETHGRVPPLRTLARAGGARVDDAAFKRCEARVLVAVHFDLGHPTAESFLRLLLRANRNTLNVHSEVRSIARYFVELSATAHAGVFVGVRSSTIAHAALLLAQQLYEERCVLAAYRDIADADTLRELNVLMQLLLDAADAAPPRVFRKYETARYDHAALRVRKYLADPDAVAVPRGSHSTSVPHRLAPYITYRFDIRNLVDAYGHDPVLDMCVAPITASQPPRCTSRDDAPQRRTGLATAIPGDSAVDVSRPVVGCDENQNPCRDTNVHSCLPSHPPTSPMSDTTAINSPSANLAAIEKHKLAANDDNHQPNNLNAIKPQNNVAQHPISTTTTSVNSIAPVESNYTTHTDSIPLAFATNATENQTTTSQPTVAPAAEMHVDHDNLTTITVPPNLGTNAQVLHPADTRSISSVNSCSNTSTSGKQRHDSLDESYARNVPLPSSESGSISMSEGIFDSAASSFDGTRCSVEVTRTCVVPEIPTAISSVVDITCPSQTSCKMNPINQQHQQEQPQQQNQPQQLQQQQQKQQPQPQQQQQQQQQNVAEKQPTAGFVAPSQYKALSQSLSRASSHSSTSTAYHGEQLRSSDAMNIEFSNGGCTVGPTIGIDPSWSLPHVSKQDMDLTTFPTPPMDAAAAAAIATSSTSTAVCESVAGNVFERANRSSSVTSNGTTNVTTQNTNGITMVASRSATGFVEGTTSGRHRVSMPHVTSSNVEQTIVALDPRQQQFAHQHGSNNIQHPNSLTHHASMPYVTHLRALPPNSIGTTLMDVVGQSHPPAHAGAPLVYRDCNNHDMYVNIPCGSQQFVSTRQSNLESPNKSNLHVSAGLVGYVGVMNVLNTTRQNGSTGLISTTSNAVAEGLRKWRSDPCIIGTGDITTMNNDQRSVEITSEVDYCSSGSTDICQPTHNRNHRQINGESLLRPYYGAVHSTQNSITMQPNCCASGMHYNSNFNQQTCDNSSSDVYSQDIDFVPTNVMEMNVGFTNQKFNNMRPAEYHPHFQQHQQSHEQQQHKFCAVGQSNMAQHYPADCHNTANLVNSNYLQSNCVSCKPDIGISPGHSTNTINRCMDMPQYQHFIGIDAHSRGGMMVNSSSLSVHDHSPKASNVTTNYVTSL